MRVRYYCPDCLTARNFAVDESGDFACAKCGKAFSARFDVPAEASPVERCAFCGHRAFFVQKDFDQRWGCLAMAISLGIAVFVGWRWGWIWFTPVLLSTVLVDWVIAARIGAVTICYQCNAEYRDVGTNPRHRPYDPHVAERFAEVKTVRRLR
jgi:DNA-directed RNA polymerase subunit RPC12/RpoP